MNCYQAKAGQLAKQWYLIDAENMVVGRLAAQIAPILMGKHRPTYTAHIDTGDYVIVTNVDKVVFTGNKWRQKSYQRYSGYPGGQRDEAAWKLFERHPERILELAIQRMMPKNKIGRHMMLKLKLFVGPNHTHQAQCPIPLEALSGRPTPAGAIYVTPPKIKEKAPAVIAKTAPEPVAAPEPVPTPEPVAVPEPVAAAELAPTPEPVAAAEPVVSAEAVHTPEPVAAAEPVAVPEPVAAAEPAATVDVPAGSPEPSEAPTTPESPNL